MSAAVSALEVGQRRGVGFGLPVSIPEPKRCAPFFAKHSRSPSTPSLGLETSMFATDRKVVL